MSERPVRNVAQVATALEVDTDRAEFLLFMLETMGIAERFGPGYQATAHAWATYPRPRKKAEAA